MLPRWRPTSTKELAPPALRRPRRLVLSILIAIVLFWVLVQPNGLFFYRRELFPKDKRAGSPPRFKEQWQWQESLPQHNTSLPYPEGKTGRYIKFSNQVTRLGWNNALNEILLNAHLAYASERAYVFQDYVWKPEYYPWAIPFMTFDRFRRWPRTPLSALIAGPTAGGPWDTVSSHMPRSVTEKYFDKVCPPSERRLINTKDIKPAINEASGIVIFETWQRLLLNAPERCIEIEAAPWPAESYPQTFDLYLWGSERILSLWDSFSKSPTSRLLATSPLVNSAVARNEHLFGGGDSYDRMMAMHIRRGDFKGACLELARWNSTFYSWNLLPFLPDKFTPPPGGWWGANTPENTAVYLERCLPSSEAIVEKARRAREDLARHSTQTHGAQLDVMYLLTNEDGEWLDAMKRLLKNDGWTTVVTSRDLALNDEQAVVGMAVDMDIARQAAVFIGNGWSSFTSNIVHRRLVDGKEPISIRFW
ncbi:hypothetical protein CCMSSC00406_0005793 [Pleurotus cornucopiae]|uniref:Uncharacterized protein n=1 Tax=Pleurotus cornucopiae TaxID=5321 RepID=A0ACB7J8F9_PLECO|nr:hypothetical protein CCMSSC00406_0005793 [Pleurotus cornucopiae]